MKRIAIFVLLVVALGAGLASGVKKGSADVVKAVAQPTALS